MLLELKGIKEALEENSKILSPVGDMETRVILLSCIDSITQNNVGNPANILLSQILWKKIKERFASSQTAN